MWTVFFLKIVFLFQSAANVDIVLFFLIPNFKFFNVGRLHQTGNQLNVHCLVSREVSLVEARYALYKTELMIHFNLLLFAFLEPSKVLVLRTIPMALNVWKNLMMVRRF